MMNACVESSGESGAAHSITRTGTISQHSLLVSRKMSASMVTGYMGAVGTAVEQRSIFYPYDRSYTSACPLPSAPARRPQGTGNNVGVLQRCNPAVSVRQTYRSAADQQRDRAGNKAKPRLRAPDCGAKAWRASAAPPAPLYKAPPEQAPARIRLTAICTSPGFKARKGLA